MQSLEEGRHCGDKAGRGGNREAREGEAVVHRGETKICSIVLSVKGAENCGHPKTR